MNWPKRPFVLSQMAKFHMPRPKREVFQKFQKPLNLNNASGLFDGPHSLAVPHVTSHIPKLGRAWEGGSRVGRIVSDRIIGR